MEWWTQQIVKGLVASAVTLKYSKEDIPVGWSEQELERMYRLERVENLKRGWKILRMDSCRGKDDSGQFTERESEIKRAALENINGKCEISEVCVQQTASDRPKIQPRFI